jgi:predicted acetyltransferase
MDAATPIGTFGALPKRLSWGDGSDIDTFAVIGVTVRATERRRGVLRAMMTNALHRAAENGYALASLTASEGTIYRRFGFGPALRERSVTVTRDRALPLLVGTSGEVVVVEPSSLADGVGRAVFDRFHARALGSLVRTLSTGPEVFGLRGDDGKPDAGLRAAVHRPRADAEPDGYVTYRFVDTDDHGSRIKVEDLVYADEQAYLALWEFLLSIDLVTAVRYPFARIPDPITHVLTDNRAFDIDHEEDHVWLRVLDAASVLSSRPYATDGTVLLDITDALGFAAGVFELTVQGGRGTVSQVDRSAGERMPAALSLDVATLGSLLLGAVDAAELHDLGLITGPRADAERLAAMLRPARTPHGITYF